MTGSPETPQHRTVGFMDLDALIGGKDEPTERRKAFEAGQAVERDEYAAKLTVAAIKAQETVFKAVMEGLAVAKEFDATSPMNALLIATYQEGLLKMTSAFASGERSPEGLSAHFSPGLNGASESSSRMDPTVSPGQSTSEAKLLSLPEPRKVGRPKGSKSRTPNERNGRPNPGPNSDSDRH